MSRVPSVLVRWFEPFSGALWFLFLGWTGVIAFVWTWNIGDRQLADAVGNAELRTTFEWLLRIADIAWITLGAISIYASVAESEGIAVARRWALIVGGGSGALALASVFTGVPLGRIQYGTALGMKFGPVPLGLPLLWIIVVIGAREIALRAFPRASHTQAAIIAGVLALSTDFNLEPIAARLRGFWFWRATPSTLPPIFDAPPVNYAAWLVFGTLFAWMLREDGIVDVSLPRSWKIVTVFALLNAVFLLAHLGRALRG